MTYQDDNGPPARKFFDDPAHYLRRNAVITLRRSLVRELLGDIHPRRVIDVGCGDGRLSMQYLESGAEIAMVDFSDSMLQAARANVPEARSDQVSLHHLDIGTDDLLQLAPADLVLCVGVLAHLADPRVAVGRVATLVAPGGQLLLQVTDFEKPIGRALYWLARIGRSHHYRLSKTRATEVVGFVEATGLILVGATAYPASLPGGRHLPMVIQERLIQATKAGRLTSPLRTETLLLFHRPPADMRPLARRGNARSAL